MNLEELREELNELDEALVEILNRRMEVAAEIAQVKDAMKLPLIDSGREEAILERLHKLAAHPILKEKLPALWRVIMQCAKEIRQGVDSLP